MNVTKFRLPWPAALVWPKGLVSDVTSCVLSSTLILVSSTRQMIRVLEVVVIQCECGSGFFVNECVTLPLVLVSCRNKPVNKPCGYTFPWLCQKSRKRNCLNNSPWRPQKLRSGQKLLTRSVAASSCKGCMCLTGQVVFFSGWFFTKWWMSLAVTECCRKGRRCWD